MFRCQQAMFKQLMRNSIGLAALLLLAACASPRAADATLYERLGGQAKVQTFVDSTLDRTSTDPRTMRSFDGIKIKAIKESLALYICKIGDGGCKYEGETMANAHRQSQIQPREFDAMVDILREEMDRAGVDAGAKNELLKLLAPTKRDIVNPAR